MMNKDHDSEWDPRVYSAYAVDRNRFCFILSELEYDDTFSAIIEYNASFPQPWARTDVMREICAVVGLESWDASYAALSNEGDFYVLNDPPTTQKISGAGILSADAAGAGALFDLARLGDSIWAVGAAGQVFSREKATGWRNVIFNLDPHPGFQQADLGYIDGPNGDDVYVCGVLKPLPAKLDKSTEDRLLHSNARQEDWDQAYALAEQSMPNFREVNEGRVFHWNGRAFDQIDMPVHTETIFRSVFCESSEQIWISGTRGVLLSGNARRGFRLAAKFDESQRLVSVTKFRENYVVASQNNLFSFDGVNIHPFTPLPFANRPIRPRKVQAVDDVLFFFDYREGVFRFAGRGWEKIKIPEEIYAREFKGLTRRP